jgi:hypothetical protein
LIAEWKSLVSKDFRTRSGGFLVAHENQNVRVVGLRPLRPFSASSAFLFFPIFILNSPGRLTPGAEGLTNPGTAAPRLTVSQFAIIEF